MSDSRDEVSVAPAQVVHTHVVPQDPDWFWYADSAYDWNVDGHVYTVASERKSESPKRSDRSWHSFEHYKARRGDPGMSGAIPYVHSGQNYPQGAYQLGTLRGWRSLAYGYTAAGNHANPFGEPGLPILGLPAYISEQANGDFLPPPLDLSNLEAIALRKMLPAVKQEISLVNSIIELKDFKSLAKTTARAASVSIQRGLTMRKKFRKAYRSMRTWLNKPAEATASGLYLQLQFNILPLISDVMAVRRAIASVEQQVRKLVNHAGKPQTTHFTMRPVVDEDATDSSGDWYYLMNPLTTGPFLHYQVCRLGRKVVNDPSVFHAEMQYAFVYRNWQVEHAQLLGMLDALGVNLNPAIIWNAVPWSFVVDWLLGVSRWLNDRKILNMEPQINMRGFLWSYKRERKVYTWADVERSFNPTPQIPGLESWVYPKGITLPVTHEVSYKRKVGWPAASSIESSGVSLSELTLGSALVIARRRNRKRRA